MLVLLMGLMSVDMDLEPWTAVNDGVMGGISSGEMVGIEKGLRFQGDLSLENRGGFASVRRMLEAGVEGAAGVRLRVKGDGRRYQFRLRQDRNFDGIAWAAEFETTGQWQLIELPFSRFRPVFRGRGVPGAGPVEPGRIRQIGFLIADKREGSFALDVAAITFIKEPGASG